MRRWREFSRDRPSGGAAKNEVPLLGVLRDTGYVPVMGIRAEGRFFDETEHERFERKSQLVVMDEK